MRMVERRRAREIYLFACAGDLIISDGRTPRQRFSNTPSVTPMAHCQTT
jgi:hypothetical protein